MVWQFLPTFSLSAGLPDTCASEGGLQLQPSAGISSAKSRQTERKKKKWAQFVPAYRGTLSTLITAIAIEQESTDNLRKSKLPCHCDQQVPENAPLKAVSLCTKDKAFHFKA